MVVLLVILEARLIQLAVSGAREEAAIGRPASVIIGIGIVMSVVYLIAFVVYVCFRTEWAATCLMGLHSISKLVVGVGTLGLGVVLGLALTDAGSLLVVMVMASLTFVWVSWFLTGDVRESILLARLIDRHQLLVKGSIAEWQRGMGLDFAKLKCEQRKLREYVENTRDGKPRVGLEGTRLVALAVAACFTLVGLSRLCQWGRGDRRSRSLSGLN